MGANPLDCPICEQELREPVCLDCCHLFCRQCISGGKKGEREGEGADRSACPLCDGPVGDSPLEVDRLTAYLIETSHEASETCANCDNISQPMFFCETCQQSLCADCKSRTHGARMFARHRLVPLEERARVRGRVTCPAHSLPHLLYSVDEKRLVCIDCFNGRGAENGHSFVSIEHAHRTQLEKMEKWAARLQSFQEERREESLARQRIITEINEAYRSAHNNVFSVCQQVVDTVLSIREKMTRQLEEERRQKEEECRQQMKACENSLSSASFCLLASHILCSAASTIDFLQLHGELSKRIQTQLDVPLPRPPSASPEDLSPRTELCKALEAALGVGRASWKRSTGDEGRGGYKIRSGEPVGMLGKYQMMVDLAGAFGGLLGKIDQPLKEAAAEVARLARDVQERQRDMTLRKCLLKSEHIEKTIDDLAVCHLRLSSLLTLQKELRPEMQEIWQEELDRVTRQQMMFRRKMEEAASLEEMASRALAISKQLLPFAEGIEKMTGILDKKRLHPPDPAPMESICIQINTIAPDSKQRVQAIEKEEQLRMAAQEAKKKEEEDSVKAATSNLKPLKGKKETSRGRRRVVDQMRERSPGGTDTALLSPFHRHNTSEESEAETSVEGAFMWETPTTMDGDDGCTTLVKEEHAEATLKVPFRDPQAEKDKKERQEAEVSRRHGVLSSLHQAIVEYHDGGERNLKASDVKKGERMRANTGPEEATRPLSAPLIPSTEKESPSLSSSPRLSSPSDPSPLPSHSPVPAVPFVPQEVFSGGSERGIGAFEAREKVLESLKDRISKKESEDDDPDEETLRL